MLLRIVFTICTSLHNKFYLISHFNGFTTSFTPAVQPAPQQGYPAQALYTGLAPWTLLHSELKACYSLCVYKFHSPSRWVHHLQITARWVHVGSHTRTQLLAFRSSEPTVQLLIGCEPKVRRPRGGWTHFQGLEVNELSFRLATICFHKTRWRVISLSVQIGLYSLFSLWRLCLHYGITRGCGSRLAAV